MKVDLTITISVILGISAIISPIIVTIINNKHQIKLKKIENIDLAKQKCFEIFIDNYGKYISEKNDVTKSDFIHSAYCLMSSFDLKSSDINTLVRYVDDLQILESDFERLIPKIKEQLNK